MTKCLLQRCPRCHPETPRSKAPEEAEVDPASAEKEAEAPSDPVAERLQAAEEIGAMRLRAAQELYEDLGRFSKERARIPTLAERFADRPGRTVLAEAGIDVNRLIDCYPKSFQLFLP